MTPLEWYLLAYGVIITILFLIVDVGSEDR
jgi:hypothetical protein